MATRPAGGLGVPRVRGALAWLGHWAMPILSDDTQQGTCRVRGCSCLRPAGPAVWVGVGHPRRPDHCLGDGRPVDPGAQEGLRTKEWQGILERSSGEHRGFLKGPEVHGRGPSGGLHLQKPSLCLCSSPASLMTPSSSSGTGWGAGHQPAPSLVCPCSRQPGRQGDPRLPGVPCQAGLAGTQLRGPRNPGP